MSRLRVFVVSQLSLAVHCLCSSHLLLDSQKCRVREETALHSQAAPSSRMEYFASVNHSCRVSEATQTPVSRAIRWWQHSSDKGRGERRRDPLGKAGMITGLCCLMMCCKIRDLREVYTPFDASSFFSPGVQGEEIQPFTVLSLLDKSS